MEEPYGQTYNTQVRTFELPVEEVGSPSEGMEEIRGPGEFRH